MLVFVCGGCFFWLLPHFLGVAAPATATAAKQRQRGRIATAQAVFSRSMACGCASNYQYLEASQSHQYPGPRIIVYTAMLLYRLLYAL